VRNPDIEKRAFMRFVEKFMGLPAQITSLSQSPPWLVYASH